jgi:hypothetical protein
MFIGRFQIKVKFVIFLRKIYTMKYRKTDQEYIDDYDRHTIEWLKTLEKESTVPIYTEGSASEIEYNPFSFFYQMAVKSAQTKEETIQKRKQRDEHRDWVLANTIPPKFIKCKTCNSEMFVCSHAFEDDYAKIKFFYECPNGHFPRRLFYSNGNEYIFPEKRCKKCGHSIISKSLKKKNILFTTETCSGCDDVHKDEFDLNIKPIPPIDEADRKKYCTDFIGKRTIEDELLVLKNLKDYLDQNRSTEEKEKQNGVDKIEKVTLPKIEKKLAEGCDKNGFSKFSFEKPETGRYIIVPFTVQDGSDRSEDESIRELKKCISKIVFPTNWRLMSTAINYRLGLLSGKLKAYEDEEELIKIGQEIIAKAGASKA